MPRLGSSTSTALRAKYGYEYDEYEYEGRKAWNGSTESLAPPDSGTVSRCAQLPVGRYPQAVGRVSSGAGKAH
jgi:hypothetical protein